MPIRIQLDLYPDRAGPKNPVIAGFTVSVTERKVARIKQLAKDLLGEKSVTVRELHAVTRLVISCTPALAGWPGSGPHSPYSGYRSTWMSLAGSIWRAVGHQGGVLFWRYKVDGFNGQPIRSEARITTVDMFGCSDTGGHLC